MAVFSKKEGCASATIVGGMFFYVFVREIITRKPI